MTRTLTLILTVIILGCNFNVETDSEIEQFNVLIGGIENKELLDEFLIQMENKLAKVYKAKSLNENCTYFLEDLLNTETDRKIKYDNFDCQLIYNFEKTTLASQFQYFKYDTVYYDNAIVTVDENGYEEFEIGYLDSIEIYDRISYLKENGYGELIEVGKLTSALKSKKLVNVDVKEYYRTKDISCLPMFEDYIRTLYNQKLDFENYIVKSNLFYEIYLVDMMNNKPCSK